MDPASPLPLHAVLHVCMESGILTIRVPAWTRTRIQIDATTSIALCHEKRHLYRKLVQNKAKVAHYFEEQMQSRKALASHPPKK